MLLLVILILIFVKSVILYKGFHILPLTELKRRARGKNPELAKLYKVVAQGRSVDLLLWVLAVASATAVFIILARRSWWAATIAIFVSAWIIFWAPRPKPNGIISKLTVFASPAVFKLMSYLRSPLDFMLRLFPESSTTHLHTGVYEKNDLLEIIDNQKHQLDNRIPNEDLDIVSNALSFGDNLLADVMTPRGKTRFVKENESIGPMLMDELHKTGLTIFPVVKETAQPGDIELVGSVHLVDLIDNPDSPKVRDVMQHGKHYVSEDVDLRTCLDEFIKQKTQLLVVRNHFDEVSGIITIGQLIERIIGKKLPQDIE